MKKKLLNILCFAMLILCGGGILTLSVGCGPKDYDMSGVSVKDSTFVYDGTAKGVTLEGELPEGVEAIFRYYLDEEYEELIASPINVGTYYAKVSFKGQPDYNPIADMTATLTINKAEFANLDIKIGATYKEYDFEDGETLTTEAKENADGSLYFEYNDSTYRLKVLSVKENAADVTYKVKYYSGLNADGTVDESTIVQTANTVKDLGDKIYVLLTISDDNHNEISVLKSVEVQGKIVEIATYEDLLKMNTDIYEYSPESRKNWKYILTDDIDCDGRVWQTIAPAYYQNNETFNEFFCSEFDGNGHTISNFQITEASMNYTLTLSDGTTKEVDCVYTDTTRSKIAHAGFFGFTIGSTIHDLTFKDVTVDIDMDKIYEKGEQDGKLNFTSTILYYGTLMARGVRNLKGGYNADISGQAAAVCSSVFNVTVENLNANIVAGKLYFGGLIGSDANTDQENVSFARKNLAVKNIDAKLQMTQKNKSRISAGGIVGETQSEDRTIYDACSADGKIVVLGYDKDGNYTTDGDYTTSRLNVGGILGENHEVGTQSNSHVTNTLVTLSNCTSEINFVVYSNTEGDVNFSGTYGVDYKPADGHELVVENCTSQDTIEKFTSSDARYEDENV